MSESNAFRMKPVIILPEGEMKRSEIKKLEANGICVVETQNPEQVRFVDPPPFGYSVQERAAIQLFRQLMRNKSFMVSRERFAEMYTDILLAGFLPEKPEAVKK